MCPYSVRIQENTDQNNSEYGHFLRNVETMYKCDTLRNLVPFVQLKKREKHSCLRPATLLKKRLQHRCFPVNFTNF